MVEHNVLCQKVKEDSEFMIPLMNRKDAVGFREYLSARFFVFKNDDHFLILSTTMDGRKENVYSLDRVSELELDTINKILARETHGEGYITPEFISKLKEKF